MRAEIGAAQSHGIETLDEQLETPLKQSPHRGRIVGTRRAVAGGAGTEIRIESRAE